jgi:hypothetical protein
MQIWQKRVRNARYGSSSAKRRSATQKNQRLPKLHSQKLNTRRFIKLRQLGLHQGAMPTWLSTAVLMTALLRCRGHAGISVQFPQEPVLDQTGSQAVGNGPAQYRRGGPATIQ